MGNTASKWTKDGIDAREVERWHTLKVPGCFMVPTTGQAVFGQIINLSAAGVGIICQAELQPKTIVTWVTLNETLSFEVVWCLERARDTMADPYRYQSGLISLDPPGYLEQILARIQKED